MCLSLSFPQWTWSSTPVSSKTLIISLPNSLLVYPSLVPKFTSFKTKESPWTTVTKKFLLLVNEVSWSEKVIVELLGL